mgnify:FL=1
MNNGVSYFPTGGLVRRSDKEVGRLANLGYTFSGFTPTGEEKWKSYETKQTTIIEGQKRFAELEAQRQLEAQGYDPDRPGSEIPVQMGGMEEVKGYGSRFGSAFKDEAGSHLSSLGDEVGSSVVSGFKGSAALLSQASWDNLGTGFTDPDTGPRQRNITGADAPKFEDYGEIQKAIGSMGAALIEGGPTAGGHERGLSIADYLDDIIKGVDVGTASNARISKNLEAGRTAEGLELRAGHEVTRYRRDPRRQQKSHRRR